MTFEFNLKRVRKFRKGLPKYLTKKDEDYF